MLSILIPTYNRICVELVAELSRQVRRAGVVSEIIVLDDGSTNMKIVGKNTKLEEIEGCRYVVSPENQGIAKTRNRLMDMARYDNLLFLDSDVMPVSDDFIQRHIDAIGKADVVCGGMRYRRGDGECVNILRLRYGVSHEERTVEQRKRNPYEAFISCSFMVTRKASKKNRFDESFDRYGHEDTLFGISIQKQGLSILHIDAPVYHDNLDTSDEYMSKVRTSLQSLSMHSEALAGHSKLLCLYDKLSKVGLSKVVAKCFSLLRKRMEKNLTGSDPSVPLLQAYKIGYLCSIMNLYSR